MDSSTAGLLELCLVFGSVLGLAIWELISLRRSMRGKKKDDTGKASGQAPR